MELRDPDVRYCDSYVDGLREKVADGGLSPVDLDEIVRDVAAHLARVRARADGDVPTGSVPDSTYWMIADQTYVGRITLRHRLNPRLEQLGGHVGYDVRPGFRRRGHATSALGQLLPRARARGLARVLVTCDVTNLASLRVIEANGGVAQDELQVGDRIALTRRYWIPTGP
jgi:predicted acetyltransferase